MGFWLALAPGYAAGLLGAWLVARRIAARIAADAPRAAVVRRAGEIAALVAAPPGLVIASALGGNLGGALAVRAVAAVSDDPGVQAAVAGAGVGLGAGVLLVVIVAGMAAGGATFLKVLSARR